MDTCFSQEYCSPTSHKPLRKKEAPSESTQRLEVTTTALSLNVSCLYSEEATSHSTLRPEFAFTDSCTQSRCVCTHPILHEQVMIDKGPWKRERGEPCKILTGLRSFPGVLFRFVLSCSTMLCSALLPFAYPPTALLPTATIIEPLDSSYVKSQIGLGAFIMLLAFVISFCLSSWPGGPTSPSSSD